MRICDYESRCPPRRHALPATGAGGRKTATTRHRPQWRTARLQVPRTTLGNGKRQRRTQPTEPAAYPWLPAHCAPGLQQARNPRLAPAGRTPHHRQQPAARHGRQPCPLRPNGLGWRDRPQAPPSDCAPPGQGGSPRHRQPQTIRPNNNTPRCQPHPQAGRPGRMPTR